MKNNIEVFYHNDTNTKIRVDLCGTAFQKTIHIKTNCEMDREAALNLVAIIRKAIKFLDDNRRDCDLCSGKELCPIYLGVESFDEG